MQSSHFLIGSNADKALSKREGFLARLVAGLRQNPRVVEAIQVITRLIISQGLIWPQDDVDETSYCAPFHVVLISERTNHPAWIPNNVDIRAFA